MARGGSKFESFSNIAHHADHISSWHINFQLRLGRLNPLICREERIWDTRKTDLVALCSLYSISRNFLLVRPRTDPSKLRREIDEGSAGMLERLNFEAPVLRCADTDCSSQVLTTM